MPYYLHAVDQSPTDGESFPTNALAREYLSAERPKITFIPTADEMESWRDREQSRFESGEYFQTPWAPIVGNVGTGSHYAHLSLKTPGMIAYTKSEQHGVEDRQTTVRPGKYLADFYDGIFTREQTADYIAQCQADALTLKIAITADEITRVYLGGPRSCMDREHYNDHGWTVHPVEVYGDSDLAIAYYGSIDAASGRAIVWPAKKRYGKLYGGSIATLTKLLEANGFTRGSMDGARIRAIESPDHDGWLMPYVDNVDYGRHDGNGWIVLGDGAIDVQRTCGYAADVPEEIDCNRCGGSYYEDDLTNGLCPTCYRQVRCDHCREWFDPEDSDSRGSYCNSCFEDIGCCEHCGDDFSYSEGNYTQLEGSGRSDGETWCDDCVNDHTLTCDNPDCAEEWIEVVEFSTREIAARVAARTSEHLCRECADNAPLLPCSDCGTWAPMDTATCACGGALESVLCSITLPLHLEPRGVLPCAS